MALSALFLALSWTVDAEALAPISIKATGTSSSATPGTLVAELDAGAGNQLVTLKGASVQAAGVNTQTRITITYTDASTVNVDTAALTATSDSIDEAGITHHASAGTAPNFFDTTKKIQKVRVETLGTGTGTRWAGLSATIVPSTGWPDTHNSLAITTAEPQGANCADSGAKLTTGLDDGLPTGTADNGLLEPGEVQNTQYICRGRDAGLRYTYSSSTTNSDPGTGTLRLDSTTMPAVTQLRFSETDADAIPMGAYYNSWDRSTGPYKGTLFVTKNNAPNTFLALDITGQVEDQGTWNRVNVAYVSHAGTFANGDIIKVHFAPQGDGPAGPQGPAGPEGPVATNVTVQGALDVTGKSTDLNQFLLDWSPVLVAAALIVAAHRVRQQWQTITFSLIAIVLLLHGANSYPWWNGMKIATYAVILYLIGYNLAPVFQGAKNHA